MTPVDKNGISYSWRNKTRLSEFELKACSDLFSNHYGNWSLTTPGKSGPIKLSSNMIAKYLAPDGSSVSMAFSGSDLVGHAISLRRNIRSFGIVTWVTQLVVHSDFRQKRIATNLLESIWAFSNDFGWGLATVNPFTVRTLEAATRRRCDPRSIKPRLEVLTEAGQNIEYVRGKKITVNRNESKIKTEFTIDLQALPELLAQAQPPQWKLGKLSEGEEWLAFTFKTQKPAPWDAADLDEMLKQSERVLFEAYDRMSLDSGHLWASHTETECEFIQRVTGIQLGTSEVIDFGCGRGRHSLYFASKGIRVVGVDFLAKAVEYAEDQARKLNLPNAQFVHRDVRNVNMGRQFDVALCLYDVVGSFVEQEQNEQVIANAVGHLKPGGFLVLSVMNMELTESIACTKADVYADPSVLQSLEPADIMQRTGNVFDPRHFLIDTNSGVVFRKEQFSEDGLLSSELIVRDRRYRRSEVSEMCSRHGIEELMCRPVQLGRWDTEISPTDERAKEILFVGRKRI